ncbi:YadA C-terminal domain-containing protein, partial [Acinetobacter sp. AL9]|uniref:YadA C-terminal domain-containing protein n=1 Tax=Acinetobacter sp. AL9 TaxID=3273234 RepID=UPI0035579750
AADNAATTDRAAIRTEFAAADVVLQDNINAEAATRAAGLAAATTDRAAIRTEFAAADTTLQNNIDAEAATREAADNAATTDRAAIRTEFAAADVVLQDNINAEAATRAAGLAAAATDRQAIRSEFAAADTATLASANAYTDTQVVNVNSRVNQLNSRVDDVEKTSYRGIAIALAAQQQIPNIGAGQFAVFGGVGHYEGETAGALGVASVFADGRTSVSAALGFAGGNEVGGRVGVSYVFGGK